MKRLSARAGDIRAGLSAAIALAILAPPLAPAQSPLPQPTGAIAVAGKVRDQAGQPVSSATVSIDPHQSSTAEVKTTARGEFLISVQGPGTYFLIVKKPGFHDLKTRVTLSAGEDKRLDLSLVALTSTGEPGRESHASSLEVEFAESPDFVVAGVTDATAAGGHGSNSTLRTSESLARETVGLKSEVPKPAVESRSETGLRAAVARSPESFEANHDLGEFYFHCGKFTDAIPLLEAAYRIAPNHYANAYELAQAYALNGSWAQAGRQVRELLSKKDSADAHRLLGDVDEQLEDPLAAVKEYERAVGLDSSEQNYFSWGAELLLHRAIQPSIEVLSKGVNAYPKSARMLAGLGAALYAGGSFEESAERLCQASDLEPSASAPHLFLGRLEQTVVLPPACVRQRLERFHKMQPGNAQADYYYAIALLKPQGQRVNAAASEEAQTLLEKAVTLAPQFGEAYVELGRIAAEGGNLERAIRCYRKAIVSTPDLGEAHYRLGRAYREAGQAAEAQQEFDLYRQIEKRQATENERQRRELREFVIVLKKDLPPESISNQKHN